MDGLTERTAEGQTITQMDLRNNGHERCIQRLAEYEEIGTVEECREAKERQRADTKRIRILIDYIINTMHWCPFDDEADIDFENECVGFGEVGCGECIIRHLEELNV